jgi:hypothetical protein
VKIAVQLGPAAGAPAEVAYKWDPDTDILSAQLSPVSPSEGMNGSVGLEGADGSWLILDVAAGRINGVEVAVWPDVRKLSTLAPPTNVEDVHVTIPSRRSQPNIASMEMATNLIAEADHARRNFHFRLGKPKLSRTIRLARDVLLDVDDKSQISGLWLLNVPPSPPPTNA